MLNKCRMLHSRIVRPPCHVGSYCLVANDWLRFCPELTKGSWKPNEYQTRLDIPSWNDFIYFCVQAASRIITPPRTPSPKAGVEFLRKPSKRFWESYRRGLQVITIYRLWGTGVCEKKYPCLEAKGTPRPPPSLGRQC